MEVRAGLPVVGHPQQGTNGLPVEQQDALVSPAHVGQVTLDHDAARPEGRRLLEDREEIAIVLARVEDALPAPSVEGLHDHLTTEFLHEGQQPRDLVADQRVGHQFGKAAGIELLVRRQDPRRAIQDQGCPAQPQDLSGCDVGGIHRGIGALEHHIGILIERQKTRLVELEVRRSFAAHADRLDLRDGAAALNAEVDRICIEDRVTTPRRLEHQHEGRVCRDIDRSGGIHHEDQRALRRRHPGRPFVWTILKR